MCGLCETGDMSNQSKKKLGVMTVAFLLALSSIAEPRADFGKEWVQSHPLTFTGRTDWMLSQAEFDVYLNSGFNTAHSGYPDTIGYAADNQFPWHGWRQVESLATVTGYVNNNPGNIGWLNFDEPDDTTVMIPVGQRAEELQQLTPNSIIYTSAHSEGGGLVGATYVQYLNDILTICDSDVLLSNCYPFYSDGTTDTNRWFRHLTVIREVAQTRGVPYWLWMQTMEYSGVRLPSESDARMSMFSLLSAGYTGILCYRYHGTTTERALLETDRITPSPLFAPVADAADEVIKLGQCLRFLESADIRFIPGTTQGSPHSPPTGLTNWVASAGYDSHITNITVNDDGDGKDGLVGFFTYGNSDVYFMLTNIYHAADTSSADTSLDLTVQFDSSVNELLRLNRETGQQEVVNLTNHTLNLTLPGGTGDLFKYKTGDFILTKKPACGDEGTEYLDGDITGPIGIPDCYVDEFDLEAIASQWLQCTDPFDPGCDFVPPGEELVYENMNTPSLKMMVDQDESNSWDETAEAAYERRNWVGDDIVLGGTNRMLTQVVVQAASQPWGASYFDGILRLYENDGPGGVPGTMFFEKTVQGRYISSDDLVSGNTYVKEIVFDNLEQDQIKLPETFTVALGFTDVYGDSGPGSLSGGLGIAVNASTATTIGSTNSGLYTYWDDEDGGSPNGWEATDENQNLNLQILAEPYPDQCGVAGTVRLTADVSGPEGVPDCYVNLFDMVAFAGQWLRCTVPGGCTD